MSKNSLQNKFQNWVGTLRAIKQDFSAKIRFKNWTGTFGETYQSEKQRERDGHAWED